jgi:gliding motility-associated protein GldM
MAGGKQSPRQKMINMMYLVLTALLALNVTKEVINAFVTINDSVQLSKENLDKKNQQTYSAFTQAMSVDPVKYKAVNDKANVVKKSSQELVEYINKVKEDLIRTTDGVDAGQPVPELRLMEKKDDYDVPTNVMCGDDQNGKGKIATELKDKLIAFKKTIVANAAPGTEKDMQKNLDLMINTSDPEAGSESYKEGKRTWEMQNFYHNPVVATVALLTKFQSDVRTAESQVIDQLLVSVDKNIIKLDQLSAKVIANSTIVTQGSEYKAEVFVSATSSTMQPEVYIGATWDSTAKKKIGGDPNPLPLEGGMGIYKRTAGGEGEQKWSGVIMLKKPDGSYDGFPFNSTYTVQKPSATVAAEKMNVLYIGVDNPMSISVPGVSSDKVRASISGGGSLSGGAGGKYIAKVNAPGKVTISITAETGGKQTNMGSFEYRVKRVAKEDPLIRMH